MNKYICIHGHFYQPPRENPWLSEIEKQDSAFPYHDWNERITAECYAPNAAARILGGENKIANIWNNYSRISFNFGPTLLSWMEKHRSDVYESILEADRLSMNNFSGHGSAIAQVYNHMIMPLANHRDRETQVIWGIADFEKRFKRKPEGMWLAETAADIETLDILAENGIKFTILAPGQAKEARSPDGGWFDVNGGKVDPRRPYFCMLPSGKSITLFFYEGPISRELGFGSLLKSGDNFAKRLLSAFSQEPSEPELVHIATDGETYGHHLAYGDMALAYCIQKIESGDEAKITIYGEYLEKNPPKWEVRIHDGSSWSCVHGVERWKRDCGCNSGMKPGWHQKWREPLRNALDWLRDKAAEIYERKAANVFTDPWEARNRYITVLLNGEGEISGFLQNNSVYGGTGVDKVLALKMLEMQRHALLMYTSCGWFFDELSGIETTQVMQYAARVVQLAADCFEECSDNKLENEFVSMLARAPSNVREFENGARIYSMFVKPAVVDLFRVGVHFAVTSLFNEYPEEVKIYNYYFSNIDEEKAAAGKYKFCVGRSKMRSIATQDERAISYSVLHLGDHNLIAGVREFKDDGKFAKMKEELMKGFSGGEVQEVFRLMDSYFESHSDSLWQLFKDEQERILNDIFSSMYSDIEAQFRHIYTDNYTIMSALKEKGLYVPKAYLSAVEYVLNADLLKLITKEPTAEELRNIVNEVKKWNIHLEGEKLRLTIGEEIGDAMELFYNTNAESVENLEQICETLNRIFDMGLSLDLWRAQNAYFRLGKEYYEKFKALAEKGDEQAARWIGIFVETGNYLGARFV